MLHLIKYQFYKIIRETGIMFWAMAFPLILGIMFFVAFGHTDSSENLDTIPVAIVKAENGEMFLDFLEELDEETIELEIMTEEEALKKLYADEIDGIYYDKEEPTLTVGKSGIEQSILKSILDMYNKNAALMKKIASEHPEALEEAVAAMKDWESVTEEVSVGGRTLNPYVSYFFALIAYTCLSGAFLGMQGCVDSQANLSVIGARQCVTPTHKLKLMVSNFVVLFAIHFADIMILTLMIQFVFGIDLGGNAAEIILVNLFGSMIGVSIGVLIGSVGKMPYNVKVGCTVWTTLILGFLTGLMTGDMKDLIEQNCPIINRINPAAVLSDAYYCMAVFNDAQRMTRNIIILGVMSTGLVLVAFLVTRRERYDSI